MTNKQFSPTKKRLTNNFKYFIIDFIAMEDKMIF